MRFLAASLCLFVSSSAASAAITKQTLPYDGEYARWLSESAKVNSNVWVRSEFIDKTNRIPRPQHVTLSLRTPANLPWHQVNEVTIYTPYQSIVVKTFYEESKPSKYLHLGLKLQFFKHLTRCQKVTIKAAPQVIHLHAPALSKLRELANTILSDSEISRLRE